MNNSFFLCVSAFMLSLSASADSRQLSVSVSNDLGFDKVSEPVVVRLSEVKKLKQASKDMVGFYSPSLKEPNVFLNPKELLDANLHWEQSRTGTVNGTLSKAAVHEITHAVTAGMRNELVVEGSLSQLTVRTRDDYWDHPSEIYARIAELRYNLNVEPGHVFTEQEVSKIRARCEQDLKQYKKEVKEIGKKQFKSLDQLPLDGKVIDHQLFIRYSDKEIMHLLNDTYR